MQANNDKIAQLDEEMQKRILDLHDQMEANGLQGSVQLIESLFDEKPGSDKKKKSKLKKKLR